MFKSKDILNDLKNINNDNYDNNDDNNNNNNNNKILNVRRKSDGFISFPKSSYDSPFLKDYEKDEKDGKEDKETDKSLTWDYIDIQVYSTFSYY